MWSGGPVAFVPWEGTLYDQYIDNFQGFWGNDADNWIFGYATLDRQTGNYVISGGSNDRWAYDQTWTGYWDGLFYPGDPNGDTAEGEWWVSGDTTCGIWYGDKAGD